MRAVSTPLGGRHRSPGRRPEEGKWNFSFRESSMTMSGQSGGRWASFLSWAADRESRCLIRLYRFHREGTQLPRHSCAKRLPQLQCFCYWDQPCPACPRDGPIKGKTNCWGKEWRLYLKSQQTKKMIDLCPPKTILPELEFRLRLY